MDSGSGGSVEVEEVERPTGKGRATTRKNIDLKPKMLPP